jgi:hypothetical protein
MYNQQPPSYIPPSAPPRRGPSCWLVGALTCLGIVILVVIAIVIGISSIAHSPAGKKFVSTFSSAVHTGSMVPECQAKMRTIREAIIRYHEHTGSYPNNLKQLVPTYLPDASTLHCQLDSSTDPSHVTFIYTKPTDSTSDSSTLLAFHMQMTMSFGEQTQVQDYTYSITKGGELQQNMSQSMSSNASTSSNTSSNSSNTSTSTNGQ